jgi:hypothetical protein
VVAVHVRQQDPVERRKLRRLQGRLGQSPAAQAVAQPRHLAAVQEVRVGQQRERSDAQEHRGGAAEGERDVVPGLGHARQLPRPTDADPRPDRRSGRHTAFFATRSPISPHGTRGNR